MTTILSSPEYNKVFELASQLSPEEQKLLVQKLNQTKNIMSKQEYYDFLMQGPIISEDEIRLMLNAKKEVDQCRPASM
jgi:hypothetical protein